MHTDYSVFRERLAEACRARNLTSDQLCLSIGIGGRRRVDFELIGLRTLNVERLTQTADIPID